MGVARGVNVRNRCCEGSTAAVKAVKAGVLLGALKNLTPKIPAVETVRAGLGRRELLLHVLRIEDQVSRSLELAPEAPLPGAAVQIRRRSFGKGVDLLRSNCGPAG